MTDTFSLYDLRVTIVEIRGRSVCGMQIGDAARVVDIASDDALVQDRYLKLAEAVVGIEAFHLLAQERLLVFIAFGQDTDPLLDQVRCTNDAIYSHGRILSL